MPWPASFSYSAIVQIQNAFKICGSNNQIQVIELTKLQIIRYLKMFQNFKFVETESLN